MDIGFKIDERTGRIVMMGALDNLVKGAAGQAVQNMNLLFGFDEAEGLSRRYRAKTEPGKDFPRKEAAGK